MAAEIKTNPPRPKRAPTLYFIASIKLGKGLLLLCVALGIFAMAGQDLQNSFDKLVRWLGLDPEKRFFANIGEWLDTVTPTNVRVVASGTFIYGLFLFASGLGLALRAKWAIWLAISESAFFIPIEIYELIRKRLPDTDAHRMFTHPRVGLAMLLALNILIVWYLYKNRSRLFRHHH